MLEVGPGDHPEGKYCDVRSACFRTWETLSACAGMTDRSPLLFIPSLNFCMPARDLIPGNNLNDGLPPVIKKILLPLKTMF